MALSKIKGTVIADNAINADRIADGTVVASDLLDNTITGAKLASDIAITTSGNITTTGALTSTGIDDNATSTAITIDSNENVGIGTSSPSNKLEVNGGGTFNSTTIVQASVPRFRLIDTDINGFSEITYNTNFLSFASDAQNNALNSKISFSIDASEKMRIETSGNVGIGTSSPAPAVGTDKVLEIAGSVSPGLVINDTGQAQKYQLYADSTKFKMSYGSTGFFTYDASNGNLGIGTTSPDYKLQVDGDIVPEADNTYDLGKSSLAWANIYTGDLHLSNEAKDTGNSVDGTKGNWTIQEGENDLYIINNKNGKKYKFNLEEIN